jgi:FMN-dependent NADH-azoreductase
MSTLLHVDSSPLGEASISRHLSTEFVQNWKQLQPHGRILTRDLAASPLHPIDAEWIGASYTPKSDRTSRQKEVLALSDTLIGELRQADEYVFGVPMHNFGIPSVLKLWIDQTIRAGETFSYTNGVPEGLLKNKRATFVIASGGVYDAGTAMESFDFVAPYLRKIFGFVGVTEINFIQASGVAGIHYGKIDRNTFLQPHVESIRAQFQPA